MNIVENIGLIVFAIIAIATRFLWFHALLMKNKGLTICPNCKKTKQRVQKGKYKCDTCGFIFEVDKQGEAIRHTLWSGILLIGFGIFLSIQSVLLICKMLTPDDDTINPPSVFYSIFFLSMFIILAIILLYSGIKEITGFINNRK